MLIIKAYQKTISPILSIVFGGGCRFYPTCSCYAEEAIGKHGMFKGLILSITRLFKCNPFYKGSYYDPVI